MTFQTGGKGGLPRPGGFRSVGRIDKRSIEIMLSRIKEKKIEELTVRELEELLHQKKSNKTIAALLKERDLLRLELRRLEDQIEVIERSGESGQEAQADSSQRDDPFGSGSRRGGVEEGDGRSFLAGKRKNNLKDYIAQVLLQAKGPLSASEIQRELPDVGYVSSSTNPRSFYNTVFQALQRYDIFIKERKKYRLSDEALRDDGVRQILPKKKTRLKDYITDVLDKAGAPLKVSEIASRVVIAGYDTDLEMEELNQRVAGTLKKYLNKDFDWDSQRYRLAERV